jgi:hypothetical protein
MTRPWRIIGAAPEKLTGSPETSTVTWPKLVAVQARAAAMQRDFM